MTWTSSATVSNPDVQRANIVRERKKYPILFTDCRIWDAMDDPLTGTAGTDDCALITGTPGTDAPTIQAGDIGGAASARKFAFEFAMPPEYDDGQYAGIIASAAVLTTVCDDSCTLDFNVYEVTSAGAVGSDLMSTDATSINSTTHADYTFVIDATSIVAGDKLVIVATITYSDAGDSGVMIPEVALLKMNLDVKG